MSSAAEEEPSLPVVARRGLTTANAMRLCERYSLDFTPPSYTELKLCEIVSELEELVQTLSRRK